ncbi:PREDICTED: uncharacterized protein LOC104727934 [Camelina sativa]|uniref:Uncharacterized protein LOC104727934 n=1 Tax=Camelina sativa TaxID=90675 RepID=A0ABM0US12_CAMSA|nr:PREDICTED: uncharacterized protein LOC104727934 [Camelina sativa]
MKDLMYKGNPFSWVGKRQKETIESCLDRVFVNADWQSMYPASGSEFLTLAGSDHAPVIIDIEEEIQTKRGQFRYDKRYSGCEDFIASVHRGWNRGVTDDSGGFQNKLKMCRRELSQWKKRNKSNSAELIQSLKFQLDAAVRNHSTPTHAIQQLRRQLNQAYKDEETHWKLKSRNKWLNEGDRNTKYFHASSKARKSRNRIKSILDDNGIEHFRDNVIGKVAEAYFQKLFTATPSTDFDSIISDISPRVTPEINSDLLK